MRSVQDDLKKTDAAEPHSSSRARAALQLQDHGEGRGSGAWLNFCMTRDQEEAAAEEALRHTATPRGPVSAATSPLCFPCGAATTSAATSPIPTARLRAADGPTASGSACATAAPPAAVADLTPPVRTAPGHAAPASATSPVRTYLARGVGTTDHEDAATNTMCGPTLPWGPRAEEPRGPRQGALLDATTSPNRRRSDAGTTGGAFGVSGNAPQPRRPSETSTATGCGISCNPQGPACGGVQTQSLDAPLCCPMLPVDLSRHFSETGVAACTRQSTTMLSMSSCRRTVVTRRQRIPVHHNHVLEHLHDTCDSLSTSSGSTEYLAPPGRSATDDDSTSPCWRRAPCGPSEVPKLAAARGLRGPRGRAGPVLERGLYQHHAPPRAQPAGPPPRDGVGWTVTLAGAGRNQHGDLEMRLSFPAEGREELPADAQDSVAEQAETGPGRGARGQAPTMSAPQAGQGRWSLTIRNQLPGDGEAGQRPGVSLSMTPAAPQEDRPCRPAPAAPARPRAATSDKHAQRTARRPLSIVWPRLHQEISSVAAHEASEAETVLSVTGAAIQRKAHRALPRHLGHRR
ncbi:uncharacterized protein LOC113211218 isoform X2 [Frankliniella occidentalis]|uniref:Uncharacterized protein LOC113211218 isoform X2 n=1 Tax=Frankliniella occidentalis TaxID=133901 RepID=A0A9C6U084_FRAOC|nr:uncharacterized protein LOC113211218 isoform X2 [Frankliniella occidentalis]